MPTIKYIGQKPEFTDHLFGTGLTWRPGESHPVSASVAEEMLRFTTFEPGDDSSLDEPATPIERDDDGQALEFDHPLVDLDAMTKPALIQYAHRQFGVVLQQAQKKGDMIDAIRVQAGKQVA